MYCNTFGSDSSTEKNIILKKIVEKKEMQKRQEESKRNKNLKLSHSKTESGDKKNKIALEIIDENSKPNKNLNKSRNLELPIITKVPKQKERSIVFGKIG